VYIYTYTYIYIMEREQGRTSHVKIHICIHRQCAAVFGSVLQSVAVCCSVLQRREPAM